MDRQPGKMRTAGIVAAAALLTVGLLLALVLTTIQGGTRDAITLPSAAVPAAPEAPPEPAPALFLTVERENVQAILDSMERPAAYHQSLSVTSFWNGGSSTRSVELWRSGALARAELIGPARTRHLLTDGETLWVWYDGDESARELTPDASVSFDDLTGLPTYETLTAIDPEEITEAGFVRLSDADCLYISAGSGEREDRYWVDASTQLLCRADSFDGEQQSYQLRQSACEVLAAGDASLREHFRLPDGTAVSAE